MCRRQREHEHQKSWENIIRFRENKNALSHKNEDIFEMIKCILWCQHLIMSPTSLACRVCVTFKQGSLTGTWVRTGCAKNTLVQSRGVRTMAQNRKNTTYISLMHGNKKQLLIASWELWRWMISSSCELMCCCGERETSPKNAVIGRAARLLLKCESHFFSLRTEVTTLSHDLYFSTKNVLHRKNKHVAYTELSTSITYCKVQEQMADFLMWFLCPSLLTHTRFCGDVGSGLLLVVCRCHVFLLFSPQVMLHHFSCWGFP